MAHDYLQLQEHAGSNLSFPWAELNPRIEGTFDMSLGSDGVSLGMQILIYWKDLLTACQEILGYSWRDSGNGQPAIGSNGTPRLRRKLPWQHPYLNQLWAKRITKVQGILPEGKNTQGAEVTAATFTTVKAGVGEGFFPNSGPWTDYHLAVLTIQFWRPPYYIRTDQAITIDGTPREWLRYVDKNWEISTELINREGMVFMFSPGTTNPPRGAQLPAPVGQKLVKFKVKRKWYQIPEQCIFQALLDTTLNGLPYNLTYTQTATYNPITGYQYAAGQPTGGCVNYPIGGANSAYVLTTGDTTAGSPVITNIPSNIISKLGVSGAVPAAQPIFAQRYNTTAEIIPSGAYVVSTDSATQVTMSMNSSATQTGIDIVFVNDYNIAKRFYGCPMGTLRLEGISIDPQPLHLPPSLMQIPGFGANEPIGQQQYDVTFHFEFFDPPIASGQVARGHNNMPWAGNGFWYPVHSQLNPTGTSGQVPYQTPFQYMDFQDLFKIL